MLCFTHDYAQNIYMRHFKFAKHTTSKYNLTKFKLIGQPGVQLILVTTGLGINIWGTYVFHVLSFIIRSSGDVSKRMRICPGRSTDSKTDPWSYTHVVVRCGGCGSHRGSSAQSKYPA